MKLEWDEAITVITGRVCTTESMVSIAAVLEDVADPEAARKLLCSVEQRCGEMLAAISEWEGED